MESLKKIIMEEEGNLLQIVNFRLTSASQCETHSRNF